MKFKLNPAGVSDFVETSQAKAVLRDVGDQYAREVESQAQRFANTGRFAGSIEVLPPERTPDGVKVTVTSTDPDAHLVEWGSKNNPAYAPFRKAASALGLRLKTTRRA